VSRMRRQARLPRSLWRRRAEWTLARSRRCCSCQHGSGARARSLEGVAMKSCCRRAVAVSAILDAPAVIVSALSCHRIWREK